MLNMVNTTEDAAKRGGWMQRVKCHGNYIIDSGKIMEFCFLNFYGNPDNHSLAFLK